MGYFTLDNAQTVSDELNSLLRLWWQDYVALTPVVTRVNSLLGDHADLINDHLALRTFDLPTTGLPRLLPLLEALGYRVGGQYQFPERKLDAVHLEHLDPRQPKIFISQLHVAQLSAPAQQLIAALVAQLPATLLDSPEGLAAGRRWQLTLADYQLLLAESEYAAWLAAFGFRANHFTLSVNSLQEFHTLQQLNVVLTQHQIALNQQGGEIKGSPAQKLEQSATLAELVEIPFSDQSYVIPGCFYEFALRYPQEDGSLFQGFIEGSANAIFSSTDTRA
ncbi:MAG: DUF1338 domain-containing protein [Plesiomonas sp.]